MIQFNFEGNKVTVPTSWDEVTVGHFIKKEFLGGSSLELLSALSGIPIHRLASTTVDLTDKFDEAVKFLRDDPNGWKGDNDAITELEVLGVHCTIPKNIEMEMLGQKILLSQEIAKNEYYYSCIPEAVAIYLAPQIYPDDWYDKIDEVATAIKVMPIAKVYKIADFFLSNTERFQRNGMIY